MRAQSIMGLQPSGFGVFHYTILVYKDGKSFQIGSYPNTDEGREACTKAWEDLEEILCEIGE